MVLSVPLYTVFCCAASFLMTIYFDIFGEELCEVTSCSCVFIELSARVILPPNSSNLEGTVLNVSYLRREPVRENYLSSAVLVHKFIKGSYYVFEGLSGL